MAPSKTRDQVQAEYAERIAAVRERRDLSDTGRRAHLAGAYQDARNEIRAIQAHEDAEADSRRSHLQRALFGNPSRDPSAQIGYRDALDKAARLGSADEALDLLHRSSMTGDDLMVRALGLTAANKIDDAAAVGSDSAWGKVLDQWVDHQGDAEKTSGQLAELSDLGARSSRRARVSRKLANSLAAPGELDGQLADDTLTRLRGEAQ